MITAMKLPMLVINKMPDPSTVAFFDLSESDAELPMFEGELADVEETCGACGDVLTRGVLPGSVLNAVFKCRCGALNVSPGSSA